MSVRVHCRRTKQPPSLQHSLCSIYRAHVVCYRSKFIACLSLLRYTDTRREREERKVNREQTQIQIFKKKKNEQCSTSSCRLNIWLQRTKFAVETKKKMQPNGRYGLICRKCIIYTDTDICICERERARER